MTTRISHWIDGAASTRHLRPHRRRSTTRPPASRPARSTSPPSRSSTPRWRAPPRPRREWRHVVAVAARGGAVRVPRAAAPAHADELAAIVTAEHGKVLSDAAGEIARGLENVEFATGVPQLLKGGFSEQAATGVDVYSHPPAARRRRRHHAVQLPGRWCRCGCAPTRSPAATRSSSSRARRTRPRRCSWPQLWKEAGLPDGVFTVVHGDKVAVDAILDHPDIAAVSFVGSTPIARYIYERGTAQRQAGPGPRRREEPHARAARRRHRHGRRRGRLGRLRLGRRALHGAVGRRRGRRRRRPAGRRHRGPAAQARASATAPTPTPTWAR